MPDARTPRIDHAPPWLVNAAGWSWRGLAVSAAIVATLWLLARLSVVVLPLFIALILATLALPPTDWLHRRGVPRGLASAIVVIGGLAVIIGVLAALAPSFADQIENLRPSIDSGIDAVFNQLESFGYDRARLQDLFAQGQEQLSGSSSSIISGVAGGVATAVSGLAGIALLLVLLFFFVKDSEDITDWLVARTPRNRRDVVRAVGQRAWSALSGYVRGTATVAAIDAVGVGIGLAIIGVPLVLPLALLVFLGAFLPVIGALLAGLIAVLVALASDGGIFANGLQAGLATLALIVVVQQIEGNVLQPVIMRRAVALHPVVVLSALAVGATLAGIVGAFLSLPVTAVLAAIGNELRLRGEDGEEADGPTASGEPAPTPA